MAASSSPHLILNQLCGLLLTLHFTYFTFNCRSRSAASGAGDSERHRKRAGRKGQSVNIKQKSTPFCFMCWDEVEHDSCGATWNHLVSPPLLKGHSCINQSKRNVKGPQNAEYDVEMWRRCWWWLGCIFILSSAAFSPLGSFPREVRSQKVDFFLSFFLPAKVLSLSENRAVISDHLPVEKAHQLHLISVKHDSAEKSLTLLRLRSVAVQRDSASGGNLFGRACHAPQVGAVCFSVGRLINHEYFMIACSRSDRAAGLMENINVVEVKSEWAAP